MNFGKVACIAGALAFLILLGIVGAVERGAELANLWWTVPCLAIMVICAGIIERSYNHGEK